MPTIEIELTGMNCGHAPRILEAGIKRVQESLSEGLALNYTCNRNSTDFTGGSITVGEVSPDISVMTGVAGLYILCVLALLATLYYLYIRGASARDVFYWGALSLIVPFLGPLVTFILYRFAVPNNG